MKKSEALELISRDVEHIVGYWFDTVDDAREREHGGWEEVDEDVAAAMLHLGEEGHAIALREAVIEYLKSDAGLKLIMDNQAPHFRYAKDMLEEADE